MRREQISIQVGSDSRLSFYQPAACPIVCSHKGLAGDEFVQRYQLVVDASEAMEDHKYYMLADAFPQAAL
jgi:hypothetical protein